MHEEQDHINPPRWSLRLLRLFIRKDYLEEIEGDMEEVFYDDLELFSPAKARRCYSWQALKLLRPAIIKSISGSQKLNYLGMLQHNFLITLRGFKRHKTTFLINLIGLSTGLAASLLIFLWVNDERSVDTFHETNNQLYWAMTHFDLPSGVNTWDYTPGPLAKAMLEELPEVEASVRIGNAMHQPHGVISFQDKHFETTGLFAGENFFDVLSYEILAGETVSPLSTKETVAISDQLAIKLFGSLEDALGKTLDWTNRYFEKPLLVNAIFKAPPASASIQFEAVVSYDMLIEADEWSDVWKGGYARTFLVIKEDTDITAFNEKIAEYLDFRGGNTDRFTLFVQPYAKNYLYGNYKDGVQAGGRIENVRLFSAVAIFILLIACINFMNLSTAQASRKMREIGVKKAIGANRSSLIAQFLSESLLLSLIALTVALALVYSLLPQFNVLTDKELTINLVANSSSLVLMVVLTGLFAGSYPAFYLSRFKPVEVLKGRFTSLKGEEWIRKGLVVLQFSLSIIFILGVIVINRQIEFTQEKPLGYDREHVVTFSSKGNLADPAPFKAELEKIPGITNMSTMAGPFLWGQDSGSGYSWEDGKEDDNHLFKSPKFGYDVVETLGLEIVAGRSFSKEFGDDRDRILINESAAKLMGLDDPVGTKLGYSEETREIIGVVKDFQYGSLHQEIEPMVIRFRESGRNYLLKIQAGTEAQTLEAIEKAYKSFHPAYDFSVSFLDDEYKALYRTESNVASLSNYMALVAILISSLGLLGLAAFTAERKTKEIGIRKILGASQLVIMRLLTGSFTKTVITSVIIALPIGYFLAQSWLQNFAYSVALQWWFFAAAGLSALIIAWLTVGFQTFKSATINPVRCLRDE
ncbi:MAG: ABC transporter permease [Roseivirga sp.]